VLRYIGQHHLYSRDSRNPTTFLGGRPGGDRARRRAFGSAGAVLGLWARRAAPPVRGVHRRRRGVLVGAARPLVETEVVILAVRDQVITEVAQMLLGTA